MVLLLAVHLGLRRSFISVTWVCRDPGMEARDHFHYWMVRETQAQVSTLNLLPASPLRPAPLHVRRLFSVAFGVEISFAALYSVEAGGHPLALPVFCKDMLGSFLPAAPLSAGLPGAAPTLTSNTSSPRRAGVGVKEGASLGKH